MKTSELLWPGWGSNSPIQVMNVNFPNEFTVRLPENKTHELVDLSSGSATNLIGVPSKKIEKVYSDVDRWRPFVNYGYFNPDKEKLAKNLASILGFEKGAKVCRASTGTQAGSTAIKFAWLAQFEKNKSEQRRVILSPCGSYFGHDPLTLAAGRWSGSGDHDKGKSYNDYYLPKEVTNLTYHLPSPESGIPLAESMKEAISKLGEKIAALMIEPVQFVGATKPTPDYFEGVMEVAKENDILVIADECATFGRFGSWFASKKFGLEPDIYTVGKGLSNSYEKVAATIISPNLSNRIISKDIPWGTKVMFGSTLDWMPRNVVVANAIIEEVEENSLLQHSKSLTEELFETFSLAFQSAENVYVKSLGGWVTISFNNNEVANEVRRFLLKNQGIYCYKSANRLNFLQPLVGSNMSSQEITKAVAKAHSEVK